MSDGQVDRRGRRDAAGGAGPASGDEVPGSGAPTQVALPARRWRPGVTTGVVAAAVQLVVVPWLSAPPVPSARTSP